jgi:riboflavin kinase / FMN adenylyltransferase
MATRLLRDELRRATPGRPTALTIGTFDGVHRGHRYLIDLLKTRANERGLAAGVITLHPAPLSVVRPDVHVTYIQSLDERLDQLEGLGLDAVIPVTFTSELSQVDAEDFLRALVADLGLRYFLVGPDGSVGRNRAGSGEQLREIGDRLGVEFEVAPAVTDDGHKLGSSDIREALVGGDIGRVNDLLGRRYSLRGPVVHGAHLGRTIGFPTANVALAPDRALPAFGVYAACARIEDGPDAGLYAAAINIGIRPTFNTGSPTVEAYLLDYDGDLYGRELQLTFAARLRGEQKFDGLDALKAQIARDAADAREQARCSEDA